MHTLLKLKFQSCFLTLQTNFTDFQNCFCANIRKIFLKFKFQKSFGHIAQYLQSKNNVIYSLGRHGRLTDTQIKKIMQKQGVKNERQYYRNQHKIPKQHPRL